MVDESRVRPGTLVARLLRYEALVEYDAEPNHHLADGALWDGIITIRYVHYAPDSRVRLVAD